MKAIMLESRLRKWWVTLIQSNGEREREVMIVGGNVGKIDPAQCGTMEHRNRLVPTPVLTNGIIIVDLCGPSAGPVSALSSPHLPQLSGRF